MSRSSIIAAVLTVVVVHSDTGAQSADSTILVPRVTVSLVRQASVSARDAGVIDELHVTEGQQVEPGALLAELTDEQQQLAVKAAELRLKIAVANSEDDLTVQTATVQLREAESAEQRQQVAVRLAEADSNNDVAVRLAESQRALAELELKRAESARAAFKGSVSQTEVDRLRAAAYSQELQVEQARHAHRQSQLKPEMEHAALNQQQEAIERFELMLQQEQKSLRVARITREIIENELSAAKLGLARRRVEAPFDGVIAKIDRQPGEWVEPGTSVLRLIHLRTLQAEGFLDAPSADQSLLGRNVIITLAALTAADQTDGVASDTNALTGRVTFVSSEIDPVNQQVRVRAEFENPDFSVRPGMQGSMRIVTSKE